MAVRSSIYDRNGRSASKTFRLVLFDPKIRHSTDKTTFQKFSIFRFIIFSGRSGIFDLSKTSCLLKIYS